MSKMSRKPVEFSVPETKYDWSKVDFWADDAVVNAFYILWDMFGCAEECHSAEDAFKQALLLAEALVAQVVNGIERGWED